MKQPTIYVDSIAYQPKLVAWDAEGDVTYFMVKIKHELTVIHAPDISNPYWYNQETGEQFAVEFEWEVSA